MTVPHPTSRDTPASFFGAYDIRGRYPEELGPSEIRRLGAALIERDRGPMVIGRDVRRESRTVERILLRTFRLLGCQVVRLGVQPTPVVGFSARYLGCPGFSLTASHNAPGYIGIKGFRSTGRLFSREWTRIRRSYLHPDLAFSSPANRNPPREQRLAAGNAPPRCIRAYLEHVTQGLRSSLKVVVDGRGGATTRVAPAALRRMGVRPIVLHPQFSSRFFGLSPEPTAANCRDLGAAVRETGAAFGVAFDGDGDRVAFVDDRGKWTEPEAIALFLYRKLSNPRRPLVASVDASYRCEEQVPTARVRVGGRFVTAAMRSFRANVGFEPSGHYYLPRWDPSSDGILITCILAHLVGKSGDPFHSLSAAFGAIFREHCALEYEDRDHATRAYARIQHRFKRDLERLPDGVVLRRPEGTVLIRTSNTQPAVRLTLEARNRRGLGELRRFLRPVFNDVDRTTPGSRVEKWAEP